MSTPVHRGDPDLRDTLDAPDGALPVTDPPAGFQEPTPASFRSPFSHRARATLTVMNGVQAGQVHALEDGPVFLGRSPDCDVCIDHANISRRHACLVREAAGWRIEDLGSRNGTTVGHEPADGRALHDGDRIVLGNSIALRFVMMEEDEEKHLRSVYDSAIRDPLTGAFNRRYFDLRLSSEIAYARRHGTPLSLLLVDLDHFKHVNDGYGHQAGDEVLRRFAEAVQAALRHEDVFVRYGGEEFAIVARGIVLQEARLFAERLRRVAAAARFDLDGTSVGCTVSVGVASLACCGEEPRPEQLLAIADRRLYGAKQQGRDRAVAED